MDSSYVNFQDDSYYPADKFRRMIARTQDSVIGFDGIDSFKPNASSGLTWAVEVAKGKALVSDNAGGTYWVEKITTSTVPTQGIVDGYVVLVVLDRKYGDSTNAMALDVIKLTDPIPPRSLVICKFHDTGDGIRVDEDRRFTTAGQFVVSPSGPANFGPPTGTMGLGQFSPGSQYTDLIAGVRWIKDQNGNWVRSDAGAGSLDSVNGNYGPNVTLTAADVGAVPDVIPRVTTNNKNASTDTAKWNGYSGGGYTSVNGTGGLYSNTTATINDLRLGSSTSTSFAGGSGGVIAFPNAGVSPTGTPTGAVMWASGGKLYFKNATGPALAMGTTGSLDVKSFGALGDGVADDAPAIQAALNAARAAGGGVVQVPYGTYKLTTLPLRIYRNTNLILADGASFVRGSIVQTMLLNGDSAASAYDGEGNILIEGGVWDMKGSTAVGPAMCMSFGHGKNIKVRDVVFRDIPGYHAIEFNSTHTAIVENCRFEGFTDTGGRTFSEAIQIDLAKEAAVFGGFGNYDSTPCNFVTVTNCYFNGWPRGIGSHSSVDGKLHKNIHIEGNYFNQINEMAISSYNWENVTIANNTIDDCGAGIRIKNTDATSAADTKDASGTVTNRSQHNLSVSITGNIFRNIGTVAPAIRVAGDTDTDGTSRNIYYVTVTGNSISSTHGTGDAGIGIRFDRVVSGTITGNSINNTSDAGIMVTYGSNIVISDNVVDKAADFGICSRMVSLSKVHNNIVRDSGDYGILISGGSSAMVTGNFVRDAKTYGIRVSGYDPDGGGPLPSSAVSDVVMVGNTTVGTYTVGISISPTTGFSRRYGNDARSSTIEDWSDTIRSSPTDTNSASGKS